jgi:hypothetical protein
MDHQLSEVESRSLHTFALLTFFATPNRPLVSHNALINSGTTGWPLK